MQISKDFERFANFATNVNGGSKNIADAANGLFDVGGLQRSVVSSTGDKVGAFSRSQTAKDVNNVTRDIFLKTVSDMFDGNIPVSIKKAMNIGKFDGKGRPLTAKRILIVKAAIEKYNGAGKTDGVKAMSAASYAKDMRPVTLTQKQAEKMIGASCKLFKASLSSSDKKDLAQKLIQYGQDLPAKNQRVLSNYITNLFINEQLGGFGEENVKTLAESIKTWSEFKFGDARLNGICAKLIQRHADYAEAKLKQPESFEHDYEDKAIFKQVYKDASRGNWIVNGQKFNLPVSKNEDDENTTGAHTLQVANAIKEAVPGDGARKMISILLNQGGLADMEFLLARAPVSTAPWDPLNVGEESIHAIPGGELFVGGHIAGLLTTKEVSYGLDVSEDGKTATITFSINKNINSFPGDENDYKVGTASFTQKIIVDISNDDDPKVVDVKLSQSYSPDKL